MNLDSTTRVHAGGRGTLGRRGTAYVAAALAFAVAAMPASAQHSPSGHFHVRRESHDEMVQLSFSDAADDGERGEMSVSVEPNDLRGLTAAQVSDTYSGPLHFMLVRDAGTITFDGSAANGEGNGHYTFSANAAYAANLAARGYGRPAVAEQFELAVHDVGYPLLDELKAQRYPTATIGELIRMGRHGVDVDYVHSMGALHYQFGSVAVLTKFRDHGVDADFVEQLQKAGYTNIAPEELLTLKDHGVDADYIGDLARVGYAKLTTEDLRRARDHGVTASFVDGIKRAGYTGFSMGDFVRLRDHGVTPSFARRMHEHSSAAPSAEDLVYAMDHGDGG